MQSGKGKDKEKRVSETVASRPSDGNNGGGMSRYESGEEREMEGEAGKRSERSERRVRPEAEVSTRSKKRGRSGVRS
eukprot:562390-Rhodomonas_salina.1